LADSIKVHGIIQPLTLRRLSAQEYQIISGERRYRASKLAGLASVPAYIRIADDQSLLEMALVENIQREDLNAIEVAISMNRLISECDLTHEELSGRLGKERSTVTNYLRLLKLPPEIQSSVKRQQISMGHARALAGIENISLQLMLHNELLKKGLSVRALEKLIRSYQEKEPTSRSKQDSGPDPELRRIQDRLSGYIGSKVTIQRTDDGKGRIVIPFKSDTELNFLLEVFEHLED
jgi:ParB family chromosome partitioning protein